MEIITINSFIEFTKFLHLLVDLIKATHAETSHRYSSSIDTVRGEYEGAIKSEINGPSDAWRSIYSARCWTE